jgi:hypothetical protein
VAARDAQNFTITAGDTFTLHVKLLGDDNAPATLGSPNGVWTLSTQPIPNSKAPALKKDGASGMSFTVETINGFDTWICYIDFDAADTANVAPGAHYHQLRITDGNTVSTVMSGTMTILPMQREDS